MRRQLQLWLHCAAWLATTGRRLARRSRSLAACPRRRTPPATRRGPWASTQRPRRLAASGRAYHSARLGSSCCLLHARARRRGIAMVTSWVFLLDASFIRRSTSVGPIPWRGRPGHTGTSTSTSPGTLRRSLQDHQLEGGFLGTAAAAAVLLLDGRAVSQSHLRPTL